MNTGPFAIKSSMMPNPLAFTRDLIVEHLRQIGGAPTTTTAIAAAVGRSKRGVAEIIPQLLASGRIVLISRRLGPGGGSTYSAP